MASMAEQKTEAENRSMAFMRGALSVAVIGASGDLAKKKTYPALLELWCADMLPRHVRVFGYARSAKTDDGLREMLRPYLLKTTPAEDVEAFLERCVYVQGQYGSPEAFGVLASAMDASETEEWAGISKGSGAPVEGNRLFYFAIPPNVFIEAARAIKVRSSVRTRAPLSPRPRLSPFPSRPPRRARWSGGGPASSSRSRSATTTPRRRSCARPCPTPSRRSPCTGACACSGERERKKKKRSKRS
jgi:hypothetical protein